MEFEMTRNGNFAEDSLRGWELCWNDGKLYVYVRLIEVDDYSHTLILTMPIQTNIGWTLTAHLGAQTKYRLEWALQAHGSVEKVWQWWGSVAKTQLRDIGFMIPQLSESLIPKVEVK